MDRMDTRRFEDKEVAAFVMGLVNVSNRLGNIFHFENEDIFIEEVYEVMAITKEILEDHERIINEAVRQNEKDNIKIKLMAEACITLESWGIGTDDQKKLFSAVKRDPALRKSGLKYFYTIFGIKKYIERKSNSNITAEVKEAAKVINLCDRRNKKL